MKVVRHWAEVQMMLIVSTCTRDWSWSRQSIVSADDEAVSEDCNAEAPSVMGLQLVQFEPLRHGFSASLEHSV